MAQAALPQGWLLLRRGGKEPSQTLINAPWEPFPHRGAYVCVSVYTYVCINVQGEIFGLRFVF